MASQLPLQVSGKSASERFSPNALFETIIANTGNEHFIDFLKNARLDIISITNVYRNQTLVLFYYIPIPVMRKPSFPLDANPSIVEFYESFAIMQIHSIRTFTVS